MSTRMDADAGPPVAGGPRRRLLLLALAVLVVAAVVWALVAGGAADETDAAAPEPSGPGVTEPATAGPSTSPPATPTPQGAAPSAGATDQPRTAPAGPPAEQPVEPGPVVEPALPEPLPAQPLTEDAPIGDDAVARITRLEAVEGAPQGPGQVAGPALRFTIELENTGTDPIPLDAAVVNVTYGQAATPATEISGPGRVPFAGQLPPGGRATASLVFLVPVEERGVVSVALEYRFGVPIAVFQGSAAAAPAG